MGRNFRKLDVYQKAYAFVVDCYPVSGSLIHAEDKELAYQLRRALMSIPINIAEGCGSRSEKVLLNHLSYAYGSAREVEVLICLCRDFAYFEDEVAARLLLLLDDVKKMLYGLLRRVEGSVENGKVAWRYGSKE